MWQYMRNCLSSRILILISDSFSYGIVFLRSFSCSFIVIRDAFVVAFVYCGCLVSYLSSKFHFSQTKRNESTPIWFVFDTIVISFFVMITMIKRGKEFILYPFRIVTQISFATAMNNRIIPNESYWRLKSFPRIVCHCGILKIHSRVWVFLPAFMREIKMILPDHH